MFEDIKDQLKLIAESVTGVEAVYTVKPQNVSVYPAIIISTDSHESNYLNLRDTDRSYNFIIDILGNMETNHESTQVLIEQIANDLINKLEKNTNITLNNNISFTGLTKGKLSLINTPAKICIYSINYTAKVIVNRFA